MQVNITYIYDIVLLAQLTVAHCVTLMLLSRIEMNKVCNYQWVTENGTSLTLQWWGPEGKTRHSHCSVPTPACSVLFITLHIICSNHSFTIVGISDHEVWAYRQRRIQWSKPRWAGRCEYSIFQIHNNWEKRFKTSQLTKPPFKQLWKLHQTKSCFFLLGTKANLTAALKLETSCCALLSCHSISRSWSEREKKKTRYLCNMEQNFHCWVPRLWQKLYSLSWETRVCIL